MADVNGDGVRSASPLRAFRRAAVALGAAAFVLLAAPVHAGAQVVYVPVDGTDAVLDPGSQNVTRQHVHPGLLGVPRRRTPRGAVAVGDRAPASRHAEPRVRLRHRHARVRDRWPRDDHAVRRLRVRDHVTPTDDVLLNGTADGSTSGPDPFPRLLHARGDVLHAASTSAAATSDHDDDHDDRRTGAAHVAAGKPGAGFDAVGADGTTDEESGALERGGHQAAVHRFAVRAQARGPDDHHDDA